MIKEIIKETNKDLIGDDWKSKLMVSFYILLMFSLFIGILYLGTKIAYWAFLLFIPLLYLIFLIGNMLEYFDKKNKEKKLQGGNKNG